jgi:hypothetical protein
LNTFQTDPERRGLQRYIPEIATEQQTRPEKRRRQGPNVVSEDDEVDEGIEITEIGSEESGDESEVEATQRQRAQIQQRVRDRRSGDSVSSPARFSLIRNQMNAMSSNRSNCSISWYHIPNDF